LYIGYRKNLRKVGVWENHYQNRWLRIVAHDWNQKWSFPTGNTSSLSSGLSLKPRDHYKMRFEYGQNG